MRDKHLRDKDFLNTSKYPEASFESTAVKATGAGTFDITGNLTLNGVTRPVTIAAKLMGEGADPWGGYRAGFEGSAKLRLKDFAMAMDLGPASQEAELILSVEGVRQSVRSPPELSMVAPSPRRHPGDGVSSWHDVGGFTLEQEQCDG